MKKNIKFLFIIFTMMFLFFGTKILALSDDLFPKDPRSFSPPTDIRPNSFSSSDSNNIIKEIKLAPTEEKEDLKEKSIKEIKTQSKDFVPIIIFVLIIFIVIFFAVMFFLIFRDTRET